MISLFKKKRHDPLAELRGLLGNFELGSFSSSVMNVLDLLRDPESTMAEIAAPIEMDPGMHVKVLRLVNSVGFGLVKKVSAAYQKSDTVAFDETLFFKAFANDPPGPDERAGVIGAAFRISELQLSL